LVFVASTYSKIAIKLAAQKLGVSSIYYWRACRSLGIYCPNAASYIDLKEEAKVGAFFAENPVSLAQGIQELEVVETKKIRIGLLARELGVSNAMTLELVKSMGIAAKNVSSSIEQAQADRVRRNAIRDGLVSPEFPPPIEPKKSKHKKKIIRYPTPAQYDNSLFDPRFWFQSSELKVMSVYSSGVFNDQRIIQTGGFACVAKAKISGSDWALRLLYRHQDGIEQRYEKICAAQVLGELPSELLKVRYMADELSVDGLVGRFPVLLIEWVDGTVLNRFVRRACVDQDVESLRSLKSAMRDLQRVMNLYQMSHGDLSGDNVMVISNGASISLKLLDYDSLWFPSLGDVPSAVGDGELQHPGMATRGGMPNGPSADLVAFRIYDLVLEALCVDPRFGEDETGYDFRFLCTRDEIRNISTEFTKLMAATSPTAFAELVAILDSRYEELEDFAPCSDGRLTASQERDDDNVAAIWSFDQVASELSISAGQLRRLAQRAGISASQLDSGVSNEQRGLLAKLLNGETLNDRMPSLCQPLERVPYHRTIPSDKRDSANTPLSSIVRPDGMSIEDLQKLLVSPPCEWKKVNNQYFVTKETAEYLEQKITGLIFYKEADRPPVIVTKRDQSETYSYVSLDSIDRPKWFSEEDLQGLLISPHCEWKVIEKRHFVSKSTAQYLREKIKKAIDIKEVESALESRPKVRRTQIPLIELATDLSISEAEAVGYLHELCRGKKNWALYGVLNSEEDLLRNWLEIARTGSATDRVHARDESIGKLNIPLSSIPHQGVLLGELRSFLRFPDCEWRIFGDRCFVTEESVEYLATALREFSNKKKEQADEPRKTAVAQVRAENSDRQPKKALFEVSQSTGLSIGTLEDHLRLICGYKKQWSIIGITNDEEQVLRKWLDSRPELGAVEKKSSSSQLAQGSKSLEVVSAQFGISINKLIKELAAALGHQKQWKVIGVTDAEIIRLREWRVRAGKISSAVKVRNLETKKAKDTAEKGDPKLTLEKLARLIGLTVGQTEELLTGAVGYRRQWRTKGVTEVEEKALLECLRITRSMESGGRKNNARPTRIANGSKSLEVVSAEFGISVGRLIKELAAALGHQKQWKEVGVANSEIDRLREWRDRAGKINPPSFSEKWRGKFPFRRRQ
jgi:hypothetical protein